MIQSGPDAKGKRLLPSSRLPTTRAEAFINYNKETRWLRGLRAIAAKKS